MILRTPILKKLTFIILLVSFGSILISGLFINYALNHQFQNYLTQSQLARDQQTVKVLAQIYQELGGWNNLATRPDLKRGIFFSNLRYVKDNNDKIVFVIRRSAMHPDPEPPPPPLRGEQDNHDEIHRNRGPLNPLPIKIGNKVIGTAYFRRNFTQDLLSRQDELFRKTINRSIIWSILITGIISILVAYIFARRLSTPITEMNQIARNMTNGNLETRVNDLPQDELGELGNSINQLAERLKQVEELRKKMTADVAHDLRTPLTTVRSHLEGMIDTVIPPSRENLESLLEEVKRLILLVNDLQAIVSADTSMQQFKQEPIQVKLFLQDLIKKMGPLFRKKGVSLELTDIPAVEIFSDRDALSKILDNLLSNALKFTPTGKKVIVEVELFNELIEMRVKDEGVGISEKDLPYIFERFYRTDQSRNRESGGFGLGLTIVKELITALGGTVTVASKPGEGSIFTLTLRHNKI